jgi:hypothetical protein
MGDLVAPGSGEREEHNGPGGDFVFFCVNRRDDSLGFLGGQKPCAYRVIATTDSD